MVCVRRVRIDIKCNKFTTASENQFEITVAENLLPVQNTLKKRSKSLSTLIETTIDRAKMRRASTLKDGPIITPEKPI
jgi:hypothetical protein